MLLGKHPMMFVLQKKNFFWDLDVMPVGATEMSEYTLHTRNWAHSFGLYLGQWLPIALVRNGFQSTFFIEQLRYRGEYGPERRGFIIDDPSLYFIRREQTAKATKRGRPRLPIPFYTPGRFLRSALHPARSFRDRQQRAQAR